MIELDRISRKLKEEGYSVGSQLVRDFARTLVDADLIPNQLEIEVKSDRKGKPIQKLHRATKSQVIQIDGNKIRELRLANQLTQETIAKNAEVSRGYIASIERSDQTRVSIKLAQSLSGIFGIDIAEITKNQTQNSTS